MIMAKKVLILYSSVGLGHKSIAENIGYYLQLDGMAVKLADISTVQRGKFEKAIVGTHQFINKYLPFVWSWMISWAYYVILPFRVNIAGLNYRKTLEAVKEFNPDLVISTHTSPSAVVAYIKSRGYYRGLFGIAFSDFHLHRFWLYKEADFYLANINEQKEQMIKLGILPGKIIVCGMVLKPKPTVNVEALQQKYEIDSRQKVVLLGSGSLGSQLDSGLIGKLAEYPEIKIIAVCGKNKIAFENLILKFSGNPQVEILGFQSDMNELYAIADIFITKPGGLSIAESLSWRLPILISHKLPGQEELNYHYLLDKRLVMPEPVNIVEAALKELQTKGFKKLLRENPEIEKILKRPEVWMHEFNRSFKA
jgi:processive 1,2-diacylglycerol beta-glucosyltransferase